MVDCSAFLDKSSDTCPAHRFSSIISDPATRSAINLQAAVFYGRCSHLLTGESTRMENSRERSRPRRSKKPVCRLQVGSNKRQTKYTETHSGPQLKTVSSKLPRVSVKLCKISSLRQESNRADVEKSEERSVSAPSMVTYASDEEDWYGPRIPVGETSMRQFTQSAPASEAPSPCRIRDLCEFRIESQDLAAGVAQSENRPSKPLNKGFRSVGEDISFAVKGVLRAEVNNSFDLTDLIENEETNNSREPRAQEKEMEHWMDGVGASQTGSCSEPSGVSGWAGSIGARNSSEFKTLKTAAISHDASCPKEIEILANNNVNKSLENRVEEFRDSVKDGTKHVELYDNVAVSDGGVDLQSTSTYVSKKVESQTGGNELLEGVGEKVTNNNVPTVAEGGKKRKEHLYLSNWVPVLRKKKLYIEGDLLRLTEEPSVCNSRYSTSRILERDSERRVASKNSLYALEGPLLIPDPELDPMPLFVIEKFRNGFPEDWKTVADIWASFSDHQVLKKSVSPPDLARFSLCSSEIGSKIANICAMTDGSLVSNMAAVNEGNFLAVTSTPAKEWQPHPSGAFLSDISSVHSQEMSQIGQVSENGMKGKSGRGSYRKGGKAGSSCST